MNRRLILAGLAATGGLMTTAFLQVAVAAADAPSADAFTIGDAVLPLATQNFNIFNLAGTEVGSIHTDETVTALFGSTDTDFTVTSVDPLAGEAGSSALPTVGSVYDVFNIAEGSRTSTPTFRVSAAPPTPSPTPW